MRTGSVAAAGFAALLAFAPALSGDAEADAGEPPQDADELEASAPSTYASEASSTPAMILERFDWTNRVLVVRAPDAADPDYGRFVAEARALRAELRARDLVSIVLFDDGTGHLGEGPLEPDAARSIRERFGDGPDKAELLLIGKDGGTKLRLEGEAIDLARVFAVIDGMPMRRDEAREDGRPSNTPRGLAVPPPVPDGDPSGQEPAQRDPRP